MRKTFLASAVAVLVGLAFAVPVLAATPPRLPHEIVIFPERDFVVADGYEPNTRLDITVIRPSTDETWSAFGRTDATGFLEVNHPGGVCWQTQTPDIQPGDVVRVNPAVGVTDSSRTINVAAEQAVEVGETVEVHGTAQTAGGAPIDLDLIEQRIINPDFRDHELNPDSRIGRRDIRADAGGGRVGVPGGRGDLAYDPIGPDNPDGTKWTAVYTGLNPAERQLAVEGQTRVLSWMAATPAGDRLGITIFEVGEVGGPGFGGCPPGPGPVVDPVAPNAPILYDATTRTYDASGLISAADPLVDLTQLHETVVFPERDFVVAEGYPAGTKLEVVVRRPGVGVIGSARGETGRDGVFEVNHPGGACWTGQTPRIRPEDVVDIVEYHEETNDNGTPADPTDDTVTAVADGGETQRTINVQVTRPAFINADGNLSVRGIARDAAGNPLPVGLIEQRIINPDFKDTRIGRRDIRADSTGGRVDNVPGGRGILRYDAPGSTRWTAVYRGLNGTEKDLALEGQTRVLSWLAADAAGERFGITIFEHGELGGPGFGGCPPSGGNSLPIN